jgi:lysophospholipase L1-like esterase
MLLAAVPAWLAAVTLLQALRARSALVLQADCGVAEASVARLPADAAARVLMVGDSTGAGVGAVQERYTLHGLLRHEFPFVAVCNRCAKGARTVDVIEQVNEVKAEAQQFDVALIVAGGNDVLHGTDAAAMSAHAGELVDAVASISKEIVWLSCADVGDAPVLLAPFSWWFSWRTRVMADAIGAVVRERNVDLVDFSSGVHRQRISGDRPRFFAPDGIHPTGMAYRYCFDVLRERPAIRWLTGLAPRP